MIYNFFPKTYKLKGPPQRVFYSKKTDISSKYLALFQVGLSRMSAELGKKKQANIYVVFTQFDRDYRHSFENIWNGGNKNDIVVFLGVSKDQKQNEKYKLEWADVMTFAFNKGNEELQVRLQADLEKLDILNPKPVYFLCTKILKNITAVLR